MKILTPSIMGLFRKYENFSNMKKRQLGKITWIQKTLIFVKQPLTSENKSSEILKQLSFSLVSFLSPVVLKIVLWWKEAS